MATFLQLIGLFSTLGGLLALAFSKFEVGVTPVVVGAVYLGTGGIVYAVDRLRNELRQSRPQQAPPAQWPAPGPPAAWRGGAQPPSR